MKITVKKLADLHKPAHNIRRHSDKQITEYISRDALSIRAATGTTLPMAWLRSTATTRARIRGRTLASAPLYLIVRYCKLAGLLSVQRDKGAGLLGCRVTAAALKF